jgi:hypothetical protein
MKKNEVIKKHPQIGDYAYLKDEHKIVEIIGIETVLGTNYLYMVDTEGNQHVRINPKIIHTDTDVSDNDVKHIIEEVE